MLHSPTVYYYMSYLLLSNEVLNVRILEGVAPVLLLSLLVAFNPLGQELIELVNFSLLLLQLLVAHPFQLTDSLLPLKYLVPYHLSELDVLCL